MPYEEVCYGAGSPSEACGGCLLCLLQQANYREDEQLQQLDQEREAKKKAQEAATHWMNVSRRQMREINELRNVLSELADLVENTVKGEYKPDHLTTQPARRVLEEKW